MSTSLPSQLAEKLLFNHAGLIPAIAQCHATGEVLMMAWMSREALAETLVTGRVCYWSRSRRSLWRKGETSGNVQRLVELRLDCDGDCILMQVEQTGPACHTGRRSCFFNAVGSDGTVHVMEEAPPWARPSSMSQHEAPP